MDIFAFLYSHLTLVLVSVSVILCYFMLVKREKAPPGPRLLPGIGMIPGLVGDMTGPILTKWAKDAKSDILTFRLLGMKIVVLSSYQLIKDTFSKRSEFTDRSIVNTVTILDPDHVGILFSSGQAWRDSRRVTLRRMRDLGMGTSNAENYIAKEAEIVLSKFEEFNGKAFNPKKLLSKAIANVINCFAFGKRFEYDDAKYNHTLECINLFARNAAGPIPQFMLPMRIGRWIYKDTMKQLIYWYKEGVKFVDEQITEHEENFDGAVNDLTDAFIDDIRNGDGKFSFENIRSNIIDFFGAGSDTIVGQLLWLIIYMAKFPGVQEKVYEEIEENLGDAVPTMQTKTVTPYTEATIYEVMRMNPLIFTGIPRTNLEHDFEIEGYKFEKATPVIANYWSVHFDPEVFPDPEKFDPGHFLKEGKVTNQERMVSFTVGRRSCAGENLARMEIYLFFVMFVQKFKIREPKGAELDVSARSRFGTNTPNEFEVEMILRSN